MEFENALPLPINFTVGDNTYENTKDRFPRRFNIFVPLESIDALCSHFQALKEDQSKHKEGNVFDMRERTKIRVQGVYISCLLYTSPSPRDLSTSRMPSSA